MHLFKETEDRESRLMDGENDGTTNALEASGKEEKGIKGSLPI